MISAARRTTKPKTDLPPLVNGDHLDQKAFHERYEARPEVRAELIGGVVYMSSPQKLRHGYFQGSVAALAHEYTVATPGSDFGVNTSAILGPDAEPQPDAYLYILPACGGQTAENADGYLTGAPEWIGEIGDSTESIDLNRKKLDYEKAGVREYMVAAVRTSQVFWFIRRRGKFKLLPPGADGIIRSEVFPGFSLHVAAFLNRDGQRLLATLREGLASPQHAAFVAKLAGKRHHRSNSS
jgi:Uma2 family endonuclease